MALTTRASFAGAEAFISSQPQELLSRLVGHLQQLFDVPTLEGMLPAMNKVRGVWGCEAPVRVQRRVSARRGRKEGLWAGC